MSSHWCVTLQLNMVWRRQPVHQPLTQRSPGHSSTVERHVYETLQPDV